MGPQMTRLLHLALFMAFLAGCGGGSGGNGTTETRDETYYFPPTLPSDD